MGEVVDLSAERAKRQPEPWLSKREIAEHLGVSIRTVQRYMAAGMPFHRAYPTSPVRMKVSEVDSWMREQAA